MPIIGGQVAEAPVAIATAHAPHLVPEGRAQVAGLGEVDVADLRRLTNHKYEQTIQMNTLPLLPHCYLAATSLLPHPLLLPSLLPLPRWYLTLYCYLVATSLLPALFCKVN